MALTTVPASLSATALTLTTAAQTNITSLGTLSALTISGDLIVDTNTLKVDSSNNRVGIGTTSPDEILHVKGDGARIYVDSTDYNLFSIGRRASSGAGLDQAYLRMKSAGTNTVVIDTAGDSYFNGGNVGIGTNSPGAVRLYATTSLNGNLAGQFVNTHASGSYGLKVQAGSDSSNYSFVVTDKDNSNPTQLYVRGDGNIGVGTNAPLGKLSIGAGSLNDAVLPVQISTGADGTQAWYAVNRNGAYGALFGYSVSSTYKGLVLRNVVSSGTANADGISFMTNNTSMRMHITGAGNVGIGDSTPISLLNLYKASSPDIYLQNSTTGTTTGDGLRLLQAGVDSYFWNHEAGAQIFATSNAERMRIDSSGNVGIGTPSAAKRLHIFDSTQTNQSVRFGNPAAAPYGEINYNSTGMEHLYIDSHGTTTGYGNIVFRTGATPDTRMFIHANGKVGIGGTPTDGTLHVLTASAGTVAASTQADDIVIENNAEGGMTIITPDDQSARIRFTSPSTNTAVGGASIFYRQNINKMNIGTEVSGGILALHSGAGSETMRLDNSGNVNIGAKDYHSHQASVDSVQIGYALNLYEDSYNTGTLNYAVWANNSYYSSSGGNKYMRNDEASRIMQYDGNLAFQNAPAGTADNAVTFTDRLIIDSSGRVTKPSNPSFQVRCSGVNNINAVSGYTVPYGGHSVQHNVGSHFNTSNYRFTAPVAGSYLFSASLRVDDFSSNAQYSYITLKHYNSGGSALSDKGRDLTSATGNYKHHAIVSVVYLAVGDYVNVQLVTFNDTSTDINDDSWFSGYLLG